MLIQLSDQFKKDLKVYQKKKAAQELAKIWELILEIRTYWDRPLQGKGSPELLKHLGEGLYARRINQEHRLVYRISETHLDLIACRGHYTTI